MFGVKDIHLIFVIPVLVMIGEYSRETYLKRSVPNINFFTVIFF